MKLTTNILLFIVLAETAYGAAIQQTEEYYGKSINELMSVETELKANVGSRSGERDVVLSEVPVDVITAEQIRHTGYTELSKVLEFFIAGFNFPRPSITDGTDHARPFTLRGLNPDQVLVLVNGKRLHQGALLHVNGTIGLGTSGPDLNTIPIAAIERVEVLRDGAAAQYGSDAIAGVVNIILKGYGAQNQISTTLGVTKEGDGLLKQGDFFYSHPTSYDGFFNITAEVRDRQATNRAGLDIRQQYPDGDPRNNQPYRRTTKLGDPDTKDVLLSMNTEFVRQDGIVYYSHGNFDYRESEAGAFFRTPQDWRNNPTIYPDGFLPMISPEIPDYSFTLGAKGDIFQNTKWDISYTHGFNNFHFYVKNSLNSSLGDESPTSFDSGGNKYRQQILNLDTTTKFDRLKLAGGLELRREDYAIYRGDEASYILGDTNNYAGAQGFPGFMPDNELSAHRYNFAQFLELRYQLMKDAQLVAASRHENYSDFGDTVDGKLAVSYQPLPSVLLRSSVSTGFRAPSLSQIYFTSTKSTMNMSDMLQTGIFNVDSPVARALGAKDLTPEKSKHLSAGIVYEPISNFSFSIDYFYTLIHNRIILSDAIGSWVSPDVADILSKYHVEEAMFFTNEADTKTTGFDVRLKYKKEFSKENVLKFTIAYQRNNNTIEKVKKAPSILGEDGEKLLISDYAITTLEHGQPKDSLKFLTQYFTGQMLWSLNLNWFGDYESTPRRFDAKWVVDVEGEYSFKNGIKLALGAQNLFDIYPGNIRPHFRKGKDDTLHPVFTIWI